MRIFAVVALVVYLVVLSMGLGCATFNKIVKNNALVSQLAVEAATARVLHEHPNWQNDTVRITAGAVALINAGALADMNRTVGINEIEVYIKSNIAWHRLLPEEQAILSALITQARVSLEDSFRSNGVTEPAKQAVGIRDLLTWIHDSAKRQRLDVVTEMIGG